MGGGKGMGDKGGKKVIFYRFWISDRNPGQYEFIIVLDMIEILHLKIKFL